MTINTVNSWRQVAVVKSVVALALLFLMSAPILFSQTASTGGVDGTLKDSSGAVVPNATVTATSIGTAQARTSTTDADRHLQVWIAASGQLQLKFEASGFTAVEVPSVTVVVTEISVLDQTLQVGVQTQQVEVRE